MMDARRRRWEDLRRGTCRLPVRPGGGNAKPVARPGASLLGVGVFSGLVLLVPEVLGATQLEGGRPAERRTYLGAGIAEQQFRFVSPAQAYSYDFRKALPVVLLRHRRMDLTISWGAERGRGLFASAPLRMIEGSLSSHWQIDLVNLGAEGFRARLFLPIVATTWYRHLDVESSSMPGPALDRHLVESLLGLGGGVKLMGLPLLNATGLVRATTGLGVVVDIGVSDEGETEPGEVRLSRSTEVAFELMVPNALGSKAGIAVGYQFSMHRWSDEAVGEGDDPWRGILNPGVLPKRRGRAAAYFAIVM